MDIENINRDDLVKDYESLKEKFIEKKNDLEVHLESVIRTYLIENDVKNVFKVRIISSEYVEVVIGDSDKSYSFSILFQKDYSNDYKRMFQLDYCLLCRFRSEDKYQRDYIVALGKVAEKMDVLEKRLSEFDWKSFDETESDLHIAKNRLVSYDTEVKNRDFAKTCLDIEGKLKEGSEIIIGTKSVWNENGYEKKDDVRKISKMMKKTLMFEDIWFRHKKDDVVRKIARGLWKFKERV